MRFRVLTLAILAAIFFFIAGALTIPAVLYMGEKSISDNERLILLLDEVMQQQQEDHKRVKNLEKALELAGRNPRSPENSNDATRSTDRDLFSQKEADSIDPSRSEEKKKPPAVLDLDWITATSLVDLSRAGASTITINLHDLDDPRYAYYRKHPYNLTVELFNEARLTQARCVNPPYIKVPEKRRFVDDVVVYTINLSKRDDRRREFLAHWCTSRFGEIFRWRFYFFRGTTLKDLSAKETHRFKKKWYPHTFDTYKSKGAAYKSHWDALEHFRRTKSSHHLLMLQDDAVCREAIADKFVPFMETVPENWDLIYWGGKPVDRLPWAPDGTHNLSLNDPWWRVVYNYDAQAVMYNNKKLEMWSESLQKGFEVGEFFDVWLSVLTGTSSSTVGYMPTEIYCGQRPGISDITKKRRSHKVVEKYPYWCSNLHVYDSVVSKMWGKSKLMVGLPLGVYNVEPGCHHSYKGVRVNYTHSMKFIMRALRVDPKTIRRTPQLAHFQKLDGNRSYDWEPPIWNKPL